LLRRKSAKHLSESVDMQVWATRAQFGAVDEVPFPKAFRSFFGRLFQAKDCATLPVNATPGLTEI
jgi:hypothetical protein